MFTMSMKSNIAAGIARVRATQSQIAIASAKALTFTAERVQAAERAEIAKVFDRPTPFTSNSLYLKSATPQSLQARVYFRDLRGSSKNQSRPDAHYLEPQVFGGGRVPKLFEVYLQRINVLPAGMFAVPGGGARLDSYGNMSIGQINQILSALGAAEHSAGYYANKSRRDRARRNRATDLIFAGIPRPGMPLGVWQRKGLARLTPLLIFVKAPVYRQRYDFFGVAQAVAEREFAPLFDREMQRATVGVPLAAAA